jgi:8-oxo-dGTP diphosphatase
MQPVMVQREIEIVAIPSRETMDMDMFIVNVEGAIVRGDQYLMIVRGEAERYEPGALSMPGGKVEDAPALNNVLEETLRREIREETSLEVHDEMAYVESKSFTVEDGRVQVVDVVFLCRYKSGEPNIIDKDEVASIEWLTAKEILTHPKAPQWTRQSITLAEALRLKLDLGK